jgi:formate/nitrite transporter FocA (FNT family)
MFNKAAEQSMSWFLSIGIAFTTVFLVTDSVSDPVNVTKLAAAGGLGFSVFAISIVLRYQELFQSSAAAPANPQVLAMRSTRATTLTIKAKSRRCVERPCSGAQTLR